MFCSPLQRGPRTLLPTGLRDALGSLLGGPPRGKNPVDREACLFALGMIGDGVLTLSALRRLIGHYGPQNCVLVVTPTLHPLTRREFPGVDTVTLPSEATSLLRHILPLWWHERRQFAAWRFKRRVCLSHQRSLYYEVALSWSNAGEDFRLRPETYPAQNPDTGTELLAHQRLVELVLGHPVGLAEILPRLTSVQASHDGRMLVYPLSQDGSRDAPVERVVAILRHWRNRNQAPVVLGGNPADHLRLERYLKAGRAAGVTGLSVEMPAGINAFVEHVAQCGALLSADSAAGHIGGALAKPTVVLMGPRLYGYCQPWRKSSLQKAFLFETPDADIAAALPELGSK